MVRGLLFVLFLWASPALAQWVELTPCGLRPPEQGIEIPKGPSPNLGPFWVWVPAVIAIMEIKKVPQTEIRCAVISAGTQQILVLGTADEILKKLGKK